MRICTRALTFLASVFMCIVLTQNATPYVGTFFYLCNYHGNPEQSNLDSGEVSLSVTIAGNPEYYIPGRMYAVTISSSKNFNGFFLTGLYTVKTGLGTAIPPSHLFPPSVGSNQPFGKNFLCSVVHSHVSHKPKQQLTFDWEAPRLGTGCISFLATATLGEQMLFKDATVLQLCEEGASKELPATLLMKSLHEDGVIIRDNFDSSSALDPDLWGSYIGLRVGLDCGVVLHGKAVTACKPDGRRELVTVPLNMSSDSILQFTLGAGNCNPSTGDSDITLSLGRAIENSSRCENWTTIESLRAPDEIKAATHIVPLPKNTYGAGDMCLKWKQELHPNSGTYSGCWAIDNILVNSLAEPPNYLIDNFDPVETSNWLFFPGGRIRQKCHSDQHAVVFGEEKHRHNYITTRDINLDSEVDSVLFEPGEVADFKRNWYLEGGSLEDNCGLNRGGFTVTFDGNRKTRILCTPFFDMSDAGNVRFTFGFGVGKCYSSDDFRSRVFVFVEDANYHTTSLGSLEPKKHKELKRVRLPIPPETRSIKGRVCWAQKSHRGKIRDVWVIDRIRILPVLPARPRHFAQFSVNLHCGVKGENYSIALDYSPNHGHRWYPLHEPCRHGNCAGKINTLTSNLDSQYYESWTRVTLPLPNSALGPYIRFRWRQNQELSNSIWALDNVYIGKCLEGCNGRGVCLEEECKCDFGYTGVSCKEPTGTLPSMIIDNMSTIGSITSNFVVKGASLGYSCGVVGTGKAVVFHKDGIRQIETVDVNTTTTRYLQFSLRIGSESDIGECPPPDSPDESILLHYTCNGGIMWHLLKEFYIRDAIHPKVISLSLPAHAKQSVCRFRWWQPIHSGGGRDVWALDDVSLTNKIYNAISVDFSKVNDVEQALGIHLGRVNYYCSRPNVLSFTEPYQEDEFRYLITDSMHIGPSYMLQFELVMGCSHLFVSDLDNTVYLQSSTDLGMNWELVRAGCWPPRMCEEHHTPTIYHAPEFKQWRRITILLPPHTWSSSTRFRFFQPTWSQSDSWAIANLFIGQQCPDMCNGHGQCMEGACKCDQDYHGSTCTPDQRQPTELKTDFSMISKLKSDWTAILGGDIAGSNQGCGVMLSGESIYFAKDGPRQLVSRDVDTRTADFLQFYIQVGGEGNIQCYGAESREESVLVQYSTNGGVTWQLMKEMQGLDYHAPRFVHISLPENAKSESTSFRWWQPTHSGASTDQWAIDEVVIGRYEDMNEFVDNFQPSDDPRDHDIWLTLTEGMRAPYCQSVDDTLMFANQNNDKVAVTKDLQLQTDDIIQFRINVGCSKSFSYHHPVLFQLSHDSGMTWRLVQKPCYLSDGCSSHYSEGTIYYTGTFGEWRLVVIPVTPDIAKGRVNFRWWQKGGPTSSFALDDVYIGSPCTNMCSGHGACARGECNCDEGYTGLDCVTMKDDPHGMIDRFDNMNRPGDMWDRIQGGYLGTGCGILATGNSLYFDDEGTRVARTVPLNTVDIRMLEFVVKIGSSEDIRGCRKPRSRDEAVVLDYSTDNGISWHLLKELDPTALGGSPHSVSLELPQPAKTPSTVIRWWQPIIAPGNPRSEWAIDDVIIAINDSSNVGFQENFNPMKPDVWYMAMNAIPKITCSSRDNALEFSKNGRKRYAETWDYQVTPSTFLQFDIAMGCSGTYSTLYSVQLQYSVDMGKSWYPVAEECLPPKMDCSGYHLSSDFQSDSHANWTRVTHYLPTRAVSPATRFRWLQETVTLRGNVWALDNVYLGEGCPWMCSGHGHCDSGICVCDSGFYGNFCVPAYPLPTTLRDTFDTKPLSKENWPEVYGGGISTVCGTLVSGSAMAFYKKNLRMLMTRDLDVTMISFAQFTFQYGCQSQATDWPRENTVLFQYSNNGGIIWHLLKEIFYQDFKDPRFFSLTIPSPARTNATRFRFWQPRHDGHMQSVWAVDNFYIGGAMSSADQIYETFGTDPNPDIWLFWPGGKIGGFCSFNTRVDTIHAGSSSLVFSRGPGEHAIYTRDLNVNDLTVLQFDINVGCTSQASKDYPVRLDYSIDRGKTWRILVEPCSHDTSPACAESSLDGSIYYSGTTPYWKRLTIPLTGMEICGVTRFRWHQGQFDTSDLVPEWSVGNVYIGMQCEDHCSGHGTCINGLYCQCDEGYLGDWCEEVRNIISYIKEDFDGGSRKGLDTYKWLIVSGGERTTKCGTLLSGKSLYFGNEGQRMLVTTDMDLSVGRVIQFFIKLGCKLKIKQSNEPDAEPILLQYSINGGINWNTIEQFPFTKVNRDPRYVAIHMPNNARTASTRVRWWQPSINGSHVGGWAIDQIFIGGDVNGRVVLQDDLVSLNTDNWLMYPGAIIEPTCGKTANSLHFTGVDPIRYAVTNDVKVTESTYMQFHVSMGCSYGDKCFGIELQYSLDLGKTWELLETECVPSNVDCASYRRNSVLSSDVYYDWTRVNYALPYYTRSEATRFRWLHQHRGLFNPDNTWAITKLYIGDECFCSCGGHGFCDRGVCLCDKGWGGENCAFPLEALPTMLSDSFNERPQKSNWKKINGGTVDNVCGVLGSGQSLHFIGGCTRQLITTDLSLENAMFIQFNFKFGCADAPVDRNEGVVIDFSTNAGTRWHKIIELYYDQYKQARFVTVELPKDVKKDGVRIRWWQPHHRGAAKADWAIDNIVIGGKSENPNEVKDGFDTGPSQSIWLESDNINVGDYCGYKHTVLGQAKDDEAVTLTTTDVDIKDGNILQFSISVGCNVAWDLNISPIYLEYSTDFGMSWQPLERECLPFYRICNGHITIPTIYYASGGWRRETIILKGPMVSRATRFRWRQVYESGSKGKLQDWALDDVYIGVACRDICRGHGQCDYPICICDKGYAGPTCHQVISIQPYLKDNFNKGLIDREKWSLVQGGTVEIGCREIIDGPGLHFRGKGQRQAVTVDLDLRNARFIQYCALIGGPSTKRECGSPKSRNESVILQYSNNGGIAWHTLHVLDHDGYWRAPKRDYIFLPQQARTNNTRMRWWQISGAESNSPSGWTLDDIYIGGSAINPSELYETFEHSLNEMRWEFYPNGVISPGACGRPGNAMTWGQQQAVKSITTGEIIVQVHYMLQFMIVIGCDEETFKCDSEHGVFLQYNKDPASETWDLVYPKCLMSSDENTAECRPYKFDAGTIYTSTTHGRWTRVTLLLPPKVYSSNTRFRWVQQNTREDSPSWALDDVYIGEMCPKLCYGRGKCIRGNCLCDPGYFGESCEPAKNRLISHMNEGFEGGVISSAWWDTVEGGGIGLGCGALLPRAHGKNLYFSGCGRRQAITAEMDVTRAAKIMFVLQIGSPRQTPTCNIDFAAGSTRGAVVLQYTKNKGIDWTLLATHEPRDYQLPQGVAYEIPADARTYGVQFRWWQLQHAGAGHDQWAIDHVEIILSRQDQMFRNARKRGNIFSNDFSHRSSPR